MSSLASSNRGPVIATRANPEQAAAVTASVPAAAYDQASRLIVIQGEAPIRSGSVAVASAGTSDQAVAAECVATLEVLGAKVEVLNDVGVAGVHRLLSNRYVLERSDVVIVVAGMDGALASLVSGLVSVPVVAVPTSVGYGAGAGGIAPLLTMLNACAPGVAVVNIDNGYGAAVFAATILRAITL